HVIRIHPTVCNGEVSFCPSIHPFLLYLVLGIPPPPGSTLFPYTTLFRSGDSGSSASGINDAGQITGTSFGQTSTGFHAFLISPRSEEHTSELQSLRHLVCRLLLEKKNNMHMAANEKDPVDAILCTQISEG